MSCHGCGFEAADLCEKGRHLPSNQVPCKSCMRNPAPFKAPLKWLITDNYVPAGELADQISLFYVYQNREVRIGQRTVGWIFTLGDGKKALRTTRNRKKHYMRIFKGWGMAKDVLEFLKTQRFDVVQIQIGKTEFLNSNLDDWFTHGIEKQFLGFETQLFLPEKYMTPAKQRVWDLPK